MKLRIPEYKAKTMMKTAQMIKTASQITGTLCVVVFALASTAVRADMLTSTGANKIESHDIRFGSVDKKGSSLGAWEVNAGSSTTPSPNSFWVYCLDPLNTSQNPDTFTTTDLANFINGNGYTNVFGGANYQASGVKDFYDDNTTTKLRVLTDLKNLYEHAYADSLGSKTKSAAFQFAIWEIEGDGNSNAASKYSSASSTVSGLDLMTTDGDAAFKTQLDVYLTALNTNNWGTLGVTKYNYTVYSPDAGTPGGQVVMRATAVGSSVPEPGSLALAGLALFGVVYTRRQSKAKQV
ncbi:PEP-CTERM sorting domain-containing protein [Roseateles oligotrophus]|uniref:PEP-CTERM sorting domain-containing protein n=1 Tax=Roseateles oligotrophus TaxID=1769250 RepID=A0ABT2YGS3_9BURK|nr:PEP-CTERM sorting domain-containing protein [Roseateles oligotrophus]MCV2369260.1 PEP-CTERM sorting domain-containing protein [Roseateles oligotrophus]